MSKMRNCDKIEGKVTWKQKSLTYDNRLLQILVQSFVKGFEKILYKKNYVLIDPPGQPTVMTCNDHYFHTCCPSETEQFFSVSRTVSAGWVDFERQIIYLLHMLNLHKKSFKKIFKNPTKLRNQEILRNLHFFLQRNLQSWK